MELYSINASTPVDEKLRAIPPSCNTGVDYHLPDATPLSFRLDWLRVSASDMCIAVVFKALRSAGYHPIKGKGRHGYATGVDWHVDPLNIGAPACSVWYGGEAQRERMTIESPGKHSEAIFAVLSSTEVEFTVRRADFALDFTGVDFIIGQNVLLGVAKDWPYRGGRPSYRKIDDMGSGDGSTFYLGSGGADCMCRWYEKGKQLRDKAKPDWNRLEFQITPKSQDKGRLHWDWLCKGLRLDILRTTWAAAVLPEFIAECGDRITIMEKKPVRDFEEKLDQMTYQWSKVLTAAKQLSGEDAEGLSRMILESMDRNEKRKSELRSSERFAGVESGKE